MSESAEQRVLAQWLDLQGLCWTHVPNGRQRNRITGVLLKAEGVKPGVPDVLIFDPPPMYAQLHGTALELKGPKGRLSEPQRGWMDALARRGWAIHVAVGASAAIEYLTRRLGYGRVVSIRKEQPR